MGNLFCKIGQDISLKKHEQNTNKSLLFGKNFRKNTRFSYLTGIQLSYFICYICVRIQTNVRVLFKKVALPTCKNLG